MKINPVTRIIIIFMLSIITAFCLSACNSQPNEKKIGIVIPLQHKSLDAIVAGLTETIQKDTSIRVHFKVANAQSDINLQRAILQQMTSDKYDMVVPLGLGATQMAIATIHNKPIVGVAAAISDDERNALKHCNVTAIRDEIPPKQNIEFIHQVYPGITQITLIHSAADKILPQVAEAIEAGKQLGINIKPIMVPTLNELYSISKIIPQDSQGIFVLKDNMIVSGISTLTLVANERHLPLITSNQDSVIEGAGFALGVFERDIGVIAAKYVKEALLGKNVCDMPIVEMTDLRAFINKKMLIEEGQDPDVVISAAKKQGYPVTIVDEQTS